jgi:phosphomannomutase
VPTKEYICPGETHAISRSVHLARMAAFYPKCGDCPFRGETGELAPEFAGRRAAGGHSPRRSLVTTDGLRGIFLNELGRGEAFSLAAAFATLLWEAPLESEKPKAESGSDPTSPGAFPPSAFRLPPSVRPAVVVGYDQRPSSPELVAGVLDALRQTGCGIIEAGPATTPYLWWNVGQCTATGGILVTGAGCDPSWSGIDFVGPGGVPVVAEGGEPGASATGGRSSEAGTTHHSPISTLNSQRIKPALTLEQIESRSRRPLNRPTRSAGEFRTVRNWDAYEESVAARFHALRPLRVVVGAGTTLLQRMLESLFRRLPCELFTLPLPMRARKFDRTDDPDVLRAAAAIRETGAHVGVLIDDDAQTCAVLDETGRLISSIDVAQLLDRRVLDDEPGATVVSETDLQNPTRAAMFEAMQSSCAAFGGGTSGRFWFRETGPVCDAFLTLAAILSALSCSDAECSEVFAQSVAWNSFHARERVE